MMLVVLSLGACLCSGFAFALLWRDRVERLVAWGLGSFGAFVLAFQVLGCAAAATERAAVTAPNLAVASWAIALVTWGLATAARRLSVSGVGRGPRRPKRPSFCPAASSGHSGPRERLALLVLGACAVTLLIVAVSSGISAPPRGWDVLTYHLPRAASWLLHGDLGPYGSTGAFYPGNAEFPILALFFTGSDRLVPLIQIPFALLGAAALFGLARRLGAGVAAAGISSFVFLTSPIVFFQATVAKDDLVVTGLILAGALFLARSLEAGDRGERTRSTAAAGLAVGLALGTKYSVLPFALGLVPLVFVGEALAQRRGGVAHAGRLVAVFAIAMAIPSAFWFVRNAAVTGNPIEPLSPKLGEWIAWRGLDQQYRYVSETRAWWAFPWIDRDFEASYSGSAGFGAAFAAFFLPGLVLAVAEAWRRGARSETRAVLLSAPALVALGVAGWWVGKHHIPRFLLPAMALACAPIGLVWGGVARRARAALSVVLALGVAFSCAETLRIVFGERDITWSHGRGVSRDEFYRTPGVIRDLPPGTRVLLLAPTKHDFYQTYRYTLVGSLPGNDVVMEEDRGVAFDIKRDGALAAHKGLADAGIEYVFMRTVGVKPFTTWFDNYPWLYQKVFDITSRGYPWYREAVAITPEGRLVAGHVITRVYRVLRP